MVSDTLALAVGVTGFVGLCVLAAVLSNAGRGGRGRLASILEYGDADAQRGAAGGSSARKPRVERARTAMQSFRFKATVAATAVVAGAVVLEYLMWTYWFGPFDTVIYTIAFVFAAATLPVLILLFGPYMPTLLGSLHVTFAHIAYRVPYLLDRGTKWEYAPGTDEQVYIDGEYHDIASGFDNRSVLGWRPFGIILDKTTVDLADKRADVAAEYDRGRGQAADGGAVERGGFAERPAPAESGIDGTWLVDLKQVFARGVKQIGDTDIIETTEEVTQRKQSSTGRLSGYRSVIGSLLGIILGASMAYAMMGGIS